MQTSRRACPYRFLRPTNAGFLVIPLSYLLSAAASLTLCVASRRSASLTAIVSHIAQASFDLAVSVIALDAICTSGANPIGCKPDSFEVFAK